MNRLKYFCGFIFFGFRRVVIISIFDIKGNDFVSFGSYKING